MKRRSFFFFLHCGPLTNESGHVMTFHLHTQCSSVSIDLRVRLEITPKQHMKLSYNLSVPLAAVEVNGGSKYLCNVTILLSVLGLPIPAQDVYCSLTGIASQDSKLREQKYAVHGETTITRSYMGSSSARGLNSPSVYYNAL